MQSEIVYVLSNPAMPGLVKIGRTASVSGLERCRQLYTTGVPQPFKLEYACKVDDSRAVEAAIHRIIATHRVNNRREFFSIPPEPVISVLQLIGTPVARANDETGPSPTSQFEDEDDVPFGYQDESADYTRMAAQRRMQLGQEERGPTPRSRAPDIDFLKVGLAVGDVINFTHGPETATVQGPRKVLHDGENYSLSALTQQLTGRNNISYPTRYWHVAGVPLRRLYVEAFGGPMMKTPAG